MPKLSADHIKLNAYSRMTVRLAAQVLSETVAVNRELFTPEASETARFCRYIDKFFDCMNVRSLNESERRRKPFRTMLIAAPEIIPRTTGHGCLSQNPPMTVFK